MSISTTTNGRSGHSDVSHESSQIHTIVVSVQDRPGAVDRVVGLLRRRRANAQSLSLTPAEQPGIVRVTMTVRDSEVAVEHLEEQLRKIIDVRNVLNLTTETATSRELALIKVASSSQSISEIAQRYDAHILDTTSTSITLEITAGEEKIEHLVAELQAFGVQEIARSGRVTLSRS